MPSRRNYFSRYPENFDNVYSQGNYATLTCDSGYVINNDIYLKSARVVCDFTPSGGSSWNIVANNTARSDVSASCIRGNIVISNFILKN